MDLEMTTLWDTLAGMMKLASVLSKAPAARAAELIRDAGDAAGDDAAHLPG